MDFSDLAVGCLFVSVNCRRIFNKLYDLRAVHVVTLFVKFY